jgi:hypothetical protein
VRRAYTALHPGFPGQRKKGPSSQSSQVQFQKAGSYFVVVFWKHRAILLLPIDHYDKAASVKVSVRSDVSVIALSRADTHIPDVIRQFSFYSDYHGKKF